MLNKLYLQNLYKFNESAKYRSGEKNFSAKLSGVAENGLLHLTTTENEILKFNFKDVELLD